MHRPEMPLISTTRRKPAASNQPQRRGRPVTEPYSLPLHAQVLADFVVELGRKRTAADARRIRLRDTEHVVQLLRTDADARRRPARRRSCST